MNGKMITELNLKSIDEKTLMEKPQKVISIQPEHGMISIIIETHDSHKSIENEIFEKENSELSRYLQETKWIDYGNIRNEIVDEIPEGNSLAVAESIVKYVKGKITYDNILAEKISKGEIFGLCASEAIEKGKGTCGEYVNGVIALLRRKNIPAKYISGLYINNGKYTNHAWVEFWVDGKGWIPADIQIGSIGINHNHIKLYKGIDFDEILPELCKFEIEIISNKETD